MHKMIDFLRGRGTQRMVGFVLRENDLMRKLARSLGFVADVDASDTQAVGVVLNLPRRSDAPP